MAISVKMRKGLRIEWLGHQIKEQMIKQMESAQRSTCRFCGEEIWLDEHPTDNVWRHCTDMKISCFTEATPEET